MDINLDLKSEDGVHSMSLISPGKVRTEQTYPDALGRKGRVSCIQLHSHAALIDNDSFQGDSPGIITESGINNYYKFYYYFTTSKVRFGPIDSTLISLEADTAILFPPGEDIIGTLEPGQRVNTIHLAFHQDYFNAILDEAGMIGYIQNPRTLVIENLEPRLRAILLSMRNRNITGSLERLYLEAKVQEFLAFFLLRLGPNATTDQSNPIKESDRKKLVRAREILELRLTDPPSLAELSQMTFLNTCKLKSGFRQLFGTTVYGYVRDLRMDHAYRVLVSGEGNVTEAALEAGYTNLSHFSEAFRKKFGILPGKIKR